MVYSPQPSELGEQLKRHLTEHFDTLDTMSLADFDTPCAAFCRLTDDFLAFIENNRTALQRWLDACISGEDVGRLQSTLQCFVENMAGLLHGKNPYLAIGVDERQKLVSIYTRFLADLRDELASAITGGKLPEKLGSVFTQHQDQLAAFITSLTISNLGADFVFSQPISSTYSPELQLDILGVQVDQLQEPILDLGCGRRGELVDILRNQGKTATGVDRVAPERDHFIRIDWFDYSLGNARWGTVISHMALSIHLLHHHLRPDGNPERYAKKYMDVLQALRPSGRFIYAPGLPFIERLLPRNRYLVEKRSVTSLKGGTIDAALEKQFETSVLYSCTITKCS